MSYEVICGDALIEMPRLIERGVKVDAVVTDPPYPNGVGHFLEGIGAARKFMRAFDFARWFVFWDEMEAPPVPLPLVARHIWHRSNTNRPDNYEPIYEFNADGRKRPSRCFSFPVVYPGLTGCLEATGHPTQKNESMMAALIEKCAVRGLVLDPFMGSGTTGVACVLTGRNFIGIEQSAEYCAIGEARMKRASGEACDIPRFNKPEKDLPLFEGVA